jgi:SPP1 family predicted phage head-tail adaptor
MNIQAGRLNHLITIQQNIPAPAADHSLEDAWSSYAANVWAHIRTTGGREFWRAKQLNAEVTHEVLIRYNAGIEPSMRITWGARVLMITSVVHDEDRNKGTLIYCKELNG